MPDTIGLDSLVQEVHAAKWARRTGTVIACDTGDAVGAGGTGESTWILRTLLEEGPDLVSYIPIRDAGALQRLSEVPEGSTCAIRVGGNLDPECHPPVLVEGVSAGVVSHPYYGRFGLLRHRGVHVVITEVPWPVYTPRFYGVVGLSVWRADLVVVKNFFPFRIRFAASNRKTLLVATPGVTCWDFASLPFQRVSRPLHPLDSVQDWRPHPSMSTGEPREGRIESFL